MPNALWSQNLSKAVESGLQYLLGEQARRASRGLKRILTRLFSKLCCWMQICARLNERVVMRPPQRKSGDARNFFSAQISVACSLQAHLEALGFWTKQKVS